MPLALTAPIIHLGLMDGSAGIAVSDNAFITASDEVNWIQRFSAEAGGTGEMALNLDKEKPWFPSRPKDKKGKFHEADIEGAAQVGKRVYWISSHGYDPDLDKKQDHRVFFATDLDAQGKPVPVGKVYRSLLDDLVAKDALKTYQLEAASKIEPKESGGLNIESLCTEKDGKTLLIGFRNPIPGGKALLVPLLNPEELVEGTGKAKFGLAITPDFGGLGVRDMVWWRGKYLVIAGHYKSHLKKTNGLPDQDVPVSRLYRWNGETGGKLEPLAVDLNDYNPEALIVFQDKRVLILSDDGGNQKGLPQEETHFRSVWLEGTE